MQYGLHNRKIRFRYQNIYTVQCTLILKTNGWVSATAWPITAGPQKTE